MMKKYPSRDIGVARQFAIQGLLLCATSIPLYFVFKNQAIFAGGVLTVKNLAALGLISFGIVGEAISDNQLEKYKELKKRGGTDEVFCRDGFWQKSRHPNLFFELMTWTGFSLFGSS